jgi:trans-aconitate methyltransferase
MTEPAPQAFDLIAGEYQQKAVVQNKAAKKLLALLDLQGQEDVLDVGCGPGHVTDTLRSLTTGRVAGSDVSSGMIAEARAQYPRLEFWLAAAEDLNGEGAFDAVFCNSALQWFPDPPRALRALHRLLRPGGRLALACPTAWPTLAGFVEAVVRDPKIATVFQHWKNPWFLLPTLDAYRTLLVGAGFATRHAELADESTLVGVEPAYQIYLSGAGNGYTGRGYYDVEIDDAYMAAFNRLVRGEIEAGARDGKVDLRFQRLFYLGGKTA